MIDAQRNFAVRILTKVLLMVFGSVMIALTEEEVQKDVFGTVFCGFGFEIGNTGEEAACKLAIAVGAILLAAGLILLILDVVGHISLGNGQTTRMMLLFGMVAMLVVGVLAFATSVYLSYLWGAKTDKEVFEDRLEISAAAIISMSFISTVTAILSAVYHKKGLSSLDTVMILQ